MGQTQQLHALSALPRPPHLLHHRRETLRLAQTTKLSRRDLAVATGSSLSLLLGTLSAPSRALAEDPPDECAAAAVAKKAFIDVSIDGEPAGRIAIGLYNESAPVGSERFLSLVTGIAGVSYRRKEFVKIMPNYVQHGGVRSYGVDAELARLRGADITAERLLNEWKMARNACPGVKNVRGSVGIVVRNPKKPPPTSKLVASKGRLEIKEEEAELDPNGTEFVITAADAAELDESTLVVGKVVSGMEVLEKLLKVKTVQENTSSPYFRVAKLIGDKRAVVAERGFNRPYSKVVITNCGLFD